MWSRLIGLAIVLGFLEINVIVRSIKELIFDLPDRLRDLSSRDKSESVSIPTEALQIGLGLTPVWWAATAAQPFFVWGLSEISQKTSIEALGATSLLFYGGTMAAGMALEAKTLMEKGFSGNILSSVLYSGIRNPAVVVSISAAAGLVMGSNLVDLASIASWGAGDGGRLFFTNFEVKTAIGFGLSSLINLSILSGKIDPLLKFTNRAYEAISPIEMPVYADSPGYPKVSSPAETVFSLV